MVALVAALSLGVGAALQPVVAEGTSYLTQTFRIGAATPYNLTWPADDGAADGVLQTDGSGALTWAADLDVAGGLDVASGIEAGSGDVALVGTDGKINGPLSSTILDDLSGANLTTLDAANIATNVLASARGGVPVNAILFTTSTSCPSGYVEYTTLRGRYAVGLPLNGTSAGTAGTALTNRENRAVGQHNHTLTDPGHDHEARIRGSGSSTTVAESASASAVGNNTIVASATTGITLAQTGGVAGTPAPYVQLRACQKT